MICQLVEAQLQQLLDSRVSVTDFLESDDSWARHARSCPGCRSFAEALELATSPVCGRELSEWRAAGLADRVVASLAVAKADRRVAARTGGTFSKRLRRGWLVTALAASLLLAVGLGRLLARLGGEVDGPSVASQPTTVESEKGPEVPQRWYPRGVGLASISMAVLTSTEADMRQAASAPGEQPLLDRAIEAVRRVLPEWEPEVPTNSKTGVSLPELQLAFC
jgi:hypothetical protein